MPPMAVTPTVLNISTLFRELPLLRRPAAAKAAGYEHIEMWWPWEEAPAPTDRDADTLVRAIEDAGVHLTGLNLYAGQLSGPDAGIVSTPGRESDFRANLDAAMELGRRLRVRGFNALYGNRLPGVTPAFHDEIATGRLAVAARRAANQHATIYIEPISGPKPYPLRTSADARTVVARVASEGAEEKAGIGWLCDLYHLAANHVSPAEVADDLRRFGAQASHVQVADAPGRTTPGLGSVPLGRQLDALHTAGYRGDIALEFIPPQGTSTPAALAAMSFAR